VASKVDLCDARFRINSLIRPSRKQAMPTFTRDDATIHYEVHGEGPPVLALAPGGMRSVAEKWRVMPWDPIARLAASHQVIVMDQRNYGQSTAPITGNDGWADYRDDQLGLLDHLGIERCHVVGMCIGGSFIMELIGAAPERVAGAVMLQPIGLDNNRDTFFLMFDDWADEIMSQRPEVTDADWSGFRQNLFGGDGFMFNCGDEAVGSCQTPLLVLMGTDVYHPEATSRRVADLAPNATLIESWKEGDDLEAASAAIANFLA
jgi:pimeloyl-ACP methyl ester carboxylesterase